MYKTMSNMTLTSNHVLSEMQFTEMSVGDLPELVRLLIPGLSLASLLGLYFIVVHPVVLIMFEFTVGKMLFSKRKQLANAGEWAIITGAGDGIGKAFAYELASDGHNIMLIGRTLQKLQSVAKELEDKFHIRTKTVVADFTKTNIYQDIEKQVNSLPSISCLINNVGIMTQTLEEFAFEPILTYEKLQDLIHCNIVSTMCMTRMVLARLIKQNSGAAVINMGSAAGHQCSAFLSAYSTTKITAYQLSRCLKAELTGTNIVIQAYQPFYIATTISDGLNQNLLIPTPQAFARSALDMLGVKQNTTGYIRHELFRHLLGLCPDWLIVAVQRFWYHRMKVKTQ